MKLQVMSFWFHAVENVLEVWKVRRKKTKRFRCYDSRVKLKQC